MANSSRPKSVLTLPAKSLVIPPKPDTEGGAGGEGPPEGAGTRRDPEACAANPGAAEPGASSRT